MAAVPSPPPVWPTDPEHRRRAQQRWREHLVRMHGRQSRAAENALLVASCIFVALATAGGVWLLLDAWGRAVRAALGLPD